VIEVQWWYWVAFLGFVALMLAIDLGVFHKEARGLSAKEAVSWFTVWVSLAAAFAGIVYWRFGSAKAAEFVAGYLLEESLSVDNIFVMVLVFRSFRVPGKYQHRVLVWGIMGAVILRAALILGGTALINRFHWMNFVFGLFLVFTGIKLFFEKDDDDDAIVEDSLVVRVLKKLIRTSKDFDGQRFFTVERGKRIATPLLIVLLVVEFTDVVFALDSIPAIFGVTTDPFIVFTSNIFAILGLRTLYFLVSGMIDQFRFLKYGLAVILTFVGAKMCLHDWYQVSIGVSLGLIAGVLAISIIASRLFPETHEDKKPEDVASPPAP
jgi:tellurite resistance protein TerC